MFAPKTHPGFSKKVLTSTNKRKPFPYADCYITSDNFKTFVVSHVHSTLIYLFPRPAAVKCQRNLRGC